MIKTSWLGWDGRAKLFIHTQWLPKQLNPLFPNMSRFIPTCTDYYFPWSNHGRAQVSISDWNNSGIIALAFLFWRKALVHRPDSFIVKRQCKACCLGLAYGGDNGALVWWVVLKFSELALWSCRAPFVRNSSYKNRGGYHDRINVCWQRGLPINITSSEVFIA